MIAGATNSCFPNGPQGLHMHALTVEDVCSSLQANSSGSDNHTNFLLYNLSILKEKVHQAQSLVTMFLSPDQGHQPTESTTIAVASVGSLIQEIMVTASSMMFTCQQMALRANTASANSNVVHQSHHPHVKPSDGALCQPNRSCNRVVDGGEERGQVFYSGETIEWYGDSYITCYNNDTNHSTIAISGENEAADRKELARGDKNNDNIKAGSPTNYDMIELDAADLLAKYTHYCHVCGKGFKRDANLRMHMRAHGDEYKTSAALSNPSKNNGNASGSEASVTRLPRKYSCPQEGCRWNRKHPKFQPLKSMICAKNHYKRSHCPKMYVCKRCNQKQFSVLSDLRTHEKHCGDLKWQCSCGTTFSRKDKLMGHVALFVGHSPAVSSLTKMGKVDHNLQKMH